GLPLLPLLGRLLLEGGDLLLQLLQLRALLGAGGPGLLRLRGRLLRRAPRLRLPGLRLLGLRLQLLAVRLPLLPLLGRLLLRLGAFLGRRRLDGLRLRQGALLRLLRLRLRLLRLGELRLDLPLPLGGAAREGRLGRDLRLRGQLLAELGDLLVLHLPRLLRG